MARAVVAASLLVGALAAAPQPAPSPLCLPATWSGGYTRTGDTAGAVGNVTHNYLGKEFAIVENAFGLAKNGTFAPYRLHLYQLVNQSWIGITWEDGSTNCYRSDQAHNYVNDNCFTHTDGTRYSLNGQPARSAYNAYPNKNGSSFEIDVMLTSAHFPHFPAQSFSWTQSYSGPKKQTTRSNPNFVFINNPKYSFNSNIAQRPAECQNGAHVEEGRVADSLAQRFARRANLKSEGSHFVHPQAPAAAVHTAPPAHDLIDNLDIERDVKVCVPNTYWSDFFYMNDNFTVNGQVTHNFAKAEFGVSENITGPVLDGKTLRIRFVQKGSQAWSITEAMNGTVTKCSTTPVQYQYDRRCLSAASRRRIVVNNNAAWENHLYNPMGTTGNGPTYTAFYQSTNGLPVGILNFTAANSGYNGNPATISFFNNKMGVKKNLLAVPSICSMDAEAQAEVKAQSEKWSRHLLTSF